MNFPNIDRAAAEHQLELLGYQKGDPVYLRAIPGTGYEGGSVNLSARSPNLPWQQLENLQRQGKGIYLVINGGGHKDKDVSVGRAIFCEFDDRPIEEQVSFWQALGLPTPTFQIQTRKSVHSYWVFEKPIPIDKWRELQQDFLAFTGSDPTLKNPSRVMRLAGAWHVLQGAEPIQCDMITATQVSTKKNDPDALQSLIQIADSKSLEVAEENELPLSWFGKCSLPEQSRPNGDTSAPLPSHPDFIQIPVSATVPLECCLALQSRYLIEHGVAIGGRNTSGAKLARDLIGTHNYLLAIGQSVDGDPRQLLFDYASRCNPPLEAKEVETIWQSAAKSSPTPSCGSEGVNNCIKGWYWREHVSSQKSQVRNAAVRSQNGEVTGFAQNASKKRSAKGAKSSRSLETVLNSDLDLAWQIDEILDRHLSESEQDLALVELAKQLDNYNASEIRAIASKRIEERHRQDNLDERRTDLERLEQWENEEYSPFEDLFYDNPQVQRAFERLCRINQKIQQQYFLGLLSPMSSLVGIKGSLDVPVLGSFRATVNIALVGESGAGKSIVSKTLLKPLYRLQKELQSEHAQQKEQYQLAVEQWELQHPDVRGPKPVEKDFVTTNDAFLVINEYSREGIVKNHADNPNGLLIHQEELVAIQRAQNMYRQGKGDDRQFLNNLYDNATITRALRSERIIVPETAVAIFGGYQPAIVLREMDDLGDPDGQWARFNFINGIEKRVHTDLNQPTVDLSDFLYHLYRKALFAPSVNCRLDKQGIQLLQKFVNEMEDLHWRTLQGGLRAVYSKAAGEVCRLALGLHWTNSLIAGDTVPEIIPARAIKKAIQIKRFFLRQIQTIRTWGEADPKREEGMAPMYREIQKIARRLEGTTRLLTVRMVQQARNPLLKGLNSEGIKKIFQDLAAMGKAKLTNWKRSIALVIDSMFSDSSGGASSNNSPPTGNNPIPGNNSPWGDGNSSDSVLLKNVGDLLKDFEGPKTSLFNGLNSFVGSVETVGRCFSLTGSYLVNLPTFATVPTIAQPFTSTGFDFVEGVSTKNQPNQDEGRGQEAEGRGFQGAPAGGALSPSRRDDTFVISDYTTPDDTIEPSLLPSDLDRVPNEQSEVEWLLELLADMETANRDRFPSSTALEEVLEQANQKAASCLDQLTGVCPDYWERVGRAWGAIAEAIGGNSSSQQDLSHSLSAPESTEVQPSLAELKARVLAAQTWADLKALKKKHGQRVSEAYRSLPVEQQLIIDGISATALAGEVFKYIGKPIERDGQKLATGALVYLAPDFQLRSTSIRVPVWLIKGLKFGWLRAIEVSRDCLIAVEKAIATGTEIVKGEQGMLFEL